MGEPSPELAWERGSKLGRYVLLQKLGEGGMGVVYAAYDPELDRKVALKILGGKIKRDGTEGANAQTRLLREAQAMARVKHPNVVTVYEIGTIEDQVFVAMEFVDGTTVGRWFKDTPRTWKEIVAVFREAGKGLAAAHAAGLVHRDFKPDNVLVSRDGRVQVTDFGLARLINGGDEPTLDESSPDEKSETRLIDQQLTQAGALVGTPAYMSPEQYLRKVPDARSDQFSFCAALYFAVFRVRPFRPQELADSTSGETSSSSVSKRERSSFGRAASYGRGLIHEPPREPKVPSWFKHVLLRGLAIDPGDRFASMEELLAKLEAGPLKQRRRVYAAVATGAIALVSGAGWASVHQKRALCGEGNDRIARVWNAPVKAAISQRLVALNKPWAVEAATILSSRLDSYASHWAGMFKEACEATRVHGTQLESVMWLRMRCLDQRLHELGALNGVLQQNDPAVLSKALDASNALSSVSLCADIAALTAPVEMPKDEHVRARIEAVTNVVLEAKALHDAGRAKAALDIVAGAARDAQMIGYAPLTSLALRWLGRLQHTLGDIKGGEQNLVSAVNAADAGKDDDARVRAIIELVWAVGYGEGRYDDGLRWVSTGDAVLQRMSGNDVLELDLRDRTGSVYFAQGRYRDALEQDRRAAELAERALDPQSPMRARSLGNMSASYSELGDWTKALELSRRALDLYAQSLGHEHPLNGPVHLTLADILSRMRDFDGAVKEAKDAIRIHEQATGENHSDVADAIDFLATVQERAGRFDEALLEAQRALRIREKVLEPNNPLFADSYANIGNAYLGLKQFAKAVDPLEHALAVRSQTGMAATKVAESRFSLAQALWMADRDRSRARREAQSAQEAYRSAGEKDRLAEVDQWLKEHPARK